MGNFIRKIYSENSHFRRPHSHLTPPQHRTLTNIGISLISPENTDRGLHICLLQYLRISLYFYCAKHSRARYCHGKLAVRPSVCLSVTLRYHGHTGWNSAKIISRLISVTFSLSTDPNTTDLLQKGTPPNFSYSPVYLHSIFL